MITVVGVLFGLAYLLCLVIRPQRLVWVLAAAVPFSHTAMVNFSNFAVTPFFFGCGVAALRLLHLRLGQGRYSQVARQGSKGIRVWLWGFFAYATVITVLGPVVFAGTPVLTPRGGIDDQIGYEAALDFSISNLGQLLYLFLGIALVLYLRREPGVGLRPFELSIAIGLGLALVSYLAPQYWPSELIDNISSTHYDVWGTRLRGTFAEPSVLATFLSASIGYLVSALSRAKGGRRAWYLGALAVALFEFSLVYAGTALMALAGMIALAAPLLAVRMFRSGLLGVERITFLLIGLLILGLLFGGRVVAWATGLFTDKLDASSYMFRGLANDIALDVFVRSWGFGVGLGSNRPSSLFFMLLSCVGIVGTLMFFLLVVVSLVKAYRILAARPIVWALIGTQIAQLAAKPDLSMPVMWILLALCIRATSRSEGEVHTEGDAVEDQYAGYYDEDYDDYDDEDYDDDEPGPLRPADGEPALAGSVPAGSATTGSATAGSVGGGNGSASSGGDRWGPQATAGGPEGVSAARSPGADGRTSWSPDARRGDAWRAVWGGTTGEREPGERDPW